MANPLLISPWTGTASFKTNAEPRLFNYLYHYYEGLVNRSINKTDTPIEFQVCEHLTDNPKAKEDVMTIDSDLPLVIFHPEGDARYFHYDRLLKYGNLVSCNYTWEGVNYFPYWAYDYRNNIKSRNIPLNKATDLKAKYLCFNGRPDWHRYYMLQLLHNNDLVNKGLISFLNRYDNYENLQHISVFHKVAAGIDTKFVDSMIEAKLDIVLDKTTAQLSKDDRSHDPNLFKDTSISLVTETYAEAWRGLFITEKSWRPFAHMHIPVWIAQPGIIQHFRDYGFDTFDDIIDNRYDTYMNDISRFNEAIKALNGLLNRMHNLPQDDILLRLHKNQEKYMAMKITEEEVKKWFE